MAKAAGRTLRAAAFPEHHSKVRIFLQTAKVQLQPGNKNLPLTLTPKSDTALIY